MPLRMALSSTQMKCWAIGVLAMVRKRMSEKREEENEEEGEKEEGINGEEEQFVMSC